MGLEYVELVMDVEDRFKVHLPDEDCAKVRTVADLVALVVKRIQMSQGACPTARAFYELRTLLVTYAGLKRKQVHPKASLEELIPLGSRGVWSILRAKDSRLPTLVVSDRLQKVLWWLKVVAACTGLCAFFGMMAVSVDIALFVGIMWAVALVCSSMVLHMCFARNTPPEFATVADLVRHIAPMEMPQDSEGEQFTRDVVLEDVRKLVARSTGMPLDKVHPTSDLVRDLGMG